MSVVGGSFRGRSCAVGRLGLVGLGGLHGRSCAVGRLGIGGGLGGRGGTAASNCAAKREHRNEKDLHNCFLSSYSL